MAKGFAHTLRLLTEGSSAVSPEPTTSNVGIRSPWAVGQLSKIVWSDILGTESMPVTRTEAMAVPSIARARHILCSTIGRMPLRTLAADDTPADGPPWLYRTDGRSSVQHRMVWTVDDLIFGGWSLWLRDNTEAGDIADANRCPASLWDFDSDGTVLVRATPDGELEPADADAVILIPGYHEGILNSSARTIRGARELETQWVQRAANPIPAVELHQETDDEMDDDEIVAMIDDWKTALSDQGGAVAYTPRSITLKPHGTMALELLIQGRNAAAIDGARAVGVPAAMVDASNVNSTLTYETQEGRSTDFLDFSIPLYADPIAARLSMDDVTPAGTHVAFDASALPPTRTPAVKD